MAGTLSLVGTPIGNRGDISPRALDVLAAADTVLCEDTRVTGKLLASFDIHTRLERCDENVIVGKAPALVERLAGGEHIAFSSDAGMPCVSDPGAVLVDRVRDALDDGADIRLEVVPGPTAFASALALSGFADTAFFFGGFLPRKRSEVDRTLVSLSALEATLIFYESPHRLMDTLAVVRELLPSRRVCVARELTKLHEEVLRGTASQVLEVLDRREGGIRGEIVLLVESGRGMRAGTLDEGTIAGFVRERLEEGLSRSTVAKETARRFDVAKRVVYDAMCGTDEGEDVPSAVARAIMDAAEKA